YFFFQAEDGIRDFHVTGVQTCALPIFPDLRSDRRHPRIRPTIGRGRAKPPRRAAARGSSARALRETARDSPPRPGSSPARTASRSEERRVGKEGRSRWSEEDVKVVRKR